MTRLSRFMAWQGMPYLLTFAVLFLAALLVRLVMPFEFPIPWNDETVFIAPAHTMSSDGTFFVDALNAGRVVMWVPPGYTLLLAGVFKVVGYSFDIARWVSTVCWLVGVLLGLLLVRQLAFPHRYLLCALAATLLAFLSPYVLVNSNIARMEAFYSALFLASLLALLRGLPGIGLALVLASTVVHFNAVYMLLPYGVLLGWLILTRQSLILRASELAALVLAAAVLAAYALMIAGNLNGFLEDMAFQFKLKRSMGEPMSGPLGWLKVGLALCFAVAQLVYLRRFGAEVVLSLYGTAFMALALHGQSMWYFFSLVLGAWLLLLSALSMLAHAQHSWLRRCSVLLACGFAGVLVLQGYAKREPFTPLWPRAELLQRPFLPQAEIERIRQWAGSLPPGTRVSFGYTGIEPFFFAELHTAGVIWSAGRHNVHEVLPLRKDHYRVVCDSALYPKGVLKFDLDIPPLRQGLDTGCRIEARHALETEK